MSFRNSEHVSERSNSALKPKFHRLALVAKKQRDEEREAKIESRVAAGRPVTWYTTADADGMIVIHPRSNQ